MDVQPPLPKLDNDLDLMLDVFTHESARVSHELNQDYGDTDRLAEMGHKVYELATTFHFFSQSPLLGAPELKAERERILSPENAMRWVIHYSLHTRLRYRPELGNIVDNEQEMQKLFYTYIGAVYIRKGMQIVQEWVSRMIDPDTPPRPVPGSASYSASPPPASPDSMSVYSQPPSFLPPPPFHPPPPPSSAPPPLPPSVPASGNLSNLITLALVNQTAAQRGVQVTYPAEQQGQAHAPIWTVRCLMNGVERGRGQGRSQKVAKEEAARQAWVAMGWS